MTSPPSPTSAIAPPAGPRLNAIRAEGIRVQYAGMPNSYIGSAVMASILAAILQTDMAAHIWAPWLAAMYLQALGRWWLRRRFNAASPPDHDIARWGRYAAIGSLVSGSVWGIGAVLGFVNAQGMMQLIWTPMIIMLGAVATFAATSYLPAFYMFFYPAALPGIAMFLAQSDQLRFLIGVAFLCYLPLVTRFAHVLHQSFVDTTRLRFENLELVDALKAEKTAAEEANLAKSHFLAAASHDLRQPMHALSLFIESLSQSPLPERETGLVTNMRKSADAMESLFDALLDVSRLDAGIVEPRRSDFRLLPLLQRLNGEFEPLARACAALAPAGGAPRCCCRCLHRPGAAQPHRLQPARQCGALWRARRRQCEQRLPGGRRCRRGASEVQSVCAKRQSNLPYRRHCPASRAISDGVGHEGGVRTLEKRPRAPP